MNVNSTVKLNMPKISKLNSGAIKALEMTTNLLLSEITNAKVVPFKEGTLQNESTFADYTGASKGTTRIYSSTPYARRLYYHPEFNFSTKEHSNARGKWLDPWLKGGENQNFCSDTFKKLYKKFSGV